MSKQCPLLIDRKVMKRNKGRVKKNSEKVWSFAKPGGGGVSEGGEKTKLLF